MRGRVNAIRTFKGLVADLRFKKCSERFFSEFLENCILSCESFISLQHRTESSLRHCRIKRGKETHSFPNRNPFLLYSLLFYWLSERYKILKSFDCLISSVISKINILFDLTFLYWIRKKIRFKHSKFAMRKWLHCYL